MRKTVKSRLALLVPDIVFWRTFQGLKVALSTRNSPWAYWPRNMDEATECEGIGEILRELKPGVFWDVGCNIGCYSLYAAKLGWDVYSWDLGKRAIELLQISAERNHLKVVSNAKALTDKPIHYREVSSAYAGNRVKLDPQGPLSMTWEKAADIYPVPKFLKMDIEGAEIDFLEDKEFRRWITDKRVTLAVELHHPSCYYHLAHWKQGVCINNRFLVLPQTNEN
jgi:FkbM family methyltransferase